MSFVNVAPQLVSTAAADAARIGSAINTANTAAAATTQVLAAAQDEVSTAIAALFGSHGQHYQAISAQVAAYQQRFVLALSQAGSTYAVAEAASATPLQQIEQALLGVINTPTEALVGRKLIGDGAHGAPGTGQAGGAGGILWGNGGINGTFGTNGAGGTGGLGTPLGGHNGNIGLNGATGGIGSTTLTNATVPLQLVNTTEPVVFISLNGGQMVPVLLDTGSTGLVMDSQFLTQNFGPVIGTGTAGYAGGLTYNYNTYSTTVDFGNGLLTLPTSVNVVTSSSPGTLGNFLSRSGAVGVLGIGPNNGFPGTSSIVTAMPGLLNNGVLIDESAGILQFGPNTLTGGITISGAPISTVAVQIDNGPLQQAPVMFDSGGINGTIPSALASLPSGGFVPAGTTISVYTSDGQTLLYSYTTTATNTPFVTSGGVMNTGHVPFAQQPIYVSYSPTAIGTTTFN
ncbi:PecA family PE domain-processing aspartic protease [Mycobacterium tuberculosis]|uniref:PecA family PE domain-processing aspartic protease n=1 Tax=Mycobacterium tuberculosis TaxID=1773 RepID=UPI00106CD382|nr:PecA family PE domain-processing aspartic protease [Mycobacterium tuberculosis]